MKLTPDTAFKMLAALCAGLAAADLIIHRHAYFAVEALPFFYPVLGFAALLAVTAVSRLLQRLLTRPADYYELHPNDPAGGEDE